MPQAKPVAIGDSAIIGTRSILLPGAELGAGVRLLDDTVVSRRIPAGIVAGGVPARPVRPPA